jgi:hypothetical protein
MTDTQKPLTPADIKPVLVEIIRDNPKTVNPTRTDVEYGGVGCVLTDYKNPNRHCFVGHFVARQGWDLPPPNHPDNENAIIDTMAAQWNWPLDELAIEYLRRLQIMADGGDGEYPDPIPWGEIDIDTFDEDFGL